MRYSPLAVLLACAMTAATAHAATITFEGKITDQTCSVSVNGQTDLTVKLPTVHSGLFTSTNRSVGTTPFEVEITGCQPTSGEEETYTVTFKSANLVGDGFLSNNAASGAGNVAVRLTRDAAGSDPLVLSTPASSVIELTVPANGERASHEMAAQYMSIDSTQPVTPGKVLATVEYVLDYL